MDDAATQAPRPRRGLLAAALTIGVLGVIGFAGAGVSAGQSGGSAPGTDGGGSTLPVQQRDGERGDRARGDGDCPFKERGQQGSPGEATPDARSVSL